MTFWKRVNRKPDLEDLIDRAWYDNMLYQEGFSAGYVAGLEFAAGLYGRTPFPAEAQPKRNNYARLQRWYERQWKRLK
jgi:hypothetical protein